jgi:hypothetical protein
MLKIVQDCFLNVKEPKKVMQTILSTRKPEKVILNKETFI